MSRRHASSQTNDGGLPRTKQPKVKLQHGHRPGKGLVPVVMREIKGIGRNRDRFYDPVTGRRRTR